MKEFLKQVYAGLQASDEAGQSAAKARLKEETARLKQTDDGLAGCLSFLRREYGDDVGLYMDLLKYVLEMTEEEAFAYELMHGMMREALDKKEDFFGILELMNQTMSRRFRLGMKGDIREEWELMSYFKDGIQGMLQLSCEKIPPQQRDRDYMIVVAPPLLSPKHAPTGFALEFCRLVECYLHKKVLLISEVQETNLEFLAGKGLNLGWCRYINYEKACNGRFSYEFKGHNVDCYQIVVKKENLAQMRKLIQEIYERRPYCVWCFGVVPAYTVIMQQFTTFLYMAFNQGYFGIPADIAVNYFPGVPIQKKAERDFLSEHGVRVKDIEFPFSYAKAERTMERSEYEIPDESFAIAVVGNRLESECSQPFLSVLKDVAEETDCCLVFIGNVGEEFQNTVKWQVGHPEKIRFLGYQDRLEEVLALVDLLVNPPGMGGGTAALLAMNEGKPIVTLNQGDVAAFAGEEFVCGGLEEYPALIRKYIEEPVFYRKKSGLAGQRAGEMTAGDEERAEIIRGVLEAVEAEIK